MRAVAFSPDGKLVAFGGTGGAVTLWDVQGKKPRATLQGQHYTVLSLAFSPDGKTLASAAPQRQGNVASSIVHLWDVEKGQLRVTLTDPAPGAPLYSPDGKTLFTAPGIGEKDVLLWDPETGKKKGRLSGGPAATTLAVSPDGGTLISGSTDGSIRFWDLAKGEETAVVKNEGVAICSLAFAPDGKTIASGENDGAVRIWDVASHKQKGEAKSITHHADCVRFSLNGKLLVVSGYCKDVLVYDVKAFLAFRGGDPAENLPFTQLEGHRGEIPSFAFSPDGKQLATASGDKTVKIWEVPSPD
jgi:WD40 repeat protein